MSLILVVFIELGILAGGFVLFSVAIDMITTPFNKKRNMIGWGLFSIGVTLVVLSVVFSRLINH